MDSKQIRIFLHVAELGSLSKAAERLGLTQPALSRQIKNLEEEAGMRLFERTGRGMTLTSAGQMLEQRGQVIVNELEKIGSELAAIKGRVSGELCIGFPPSVGMRLAGPVIKRYSVLYPEVKLKVVQLLSGALEQRLIGGRIDIGVLFDGSLSANLRTQPLWQEELALISHPNSVDSNQTHITLNELFDLPLILPCTPHGLRSMLEREAFRADLNLNVVIEVESLMIQVELVRRKLGHTILPPALLGADIEAQSLVATPISQPSLNRSTILAWSKDHPLSPAGQAMAELIHSCSADVISDSKR